MLAHLDGRFICSRCGHLANPEDRAFQCVCAKCFEWRSAVETGLTANLSGVVRALRQQLLQAHKQMSQVDAAIAALGSSNVIRRSQELPAAAGNRREGLKSVRRIAPRADCEIEQNRKNLNEEETIQ
jgi:predicted ATP-dependent serine protease